MKLISLNIWGGRIYEPLKDFLKKHNDCDIFCLQEIYIHSLYQNKKRLSFADVGKLLKNHTGYYAPAVTYPSNNTIGLAIFVKNNITLDEESNIFVFKERAHYKTKEELPKDASNHPKPLQYIKFKSGAETLLVANLHGLWNPAGKIDLPERLEQSHKVRQFLDAISGAKILCGDFNLLPDTKSLSILETGMKNLVKDYGVKSTRSHFYGKPEKFADYILVSPNVEIKKFEVLPDVVSDHLPLILEFS